jgi:aspartate kinase
VKTISFEEAAELGVFRREGAASGDDFAGGEEEYSGVCAELEESGEQRDAHHGAGDALRSPFKSIAVKKRLTIMDVVASRMLMSHGYLKAIFDVFDKHKCPVDMVSTSEVSVSISLDSNEKLPAIAADLSKLADVKYEGRKALVCMVGENIRGQNGIAARVFQTVRHVNLRMISQGASEINMSFMVEEDDAEEAVRSLHAEFFSDPDPGFSTWKRSGSRRYASRRSQEAVSSQRKSG